MFITILAGTLLAAVEAPCQKAFASLQLAPSHTACWPGSPLWVDVLPLRPEDCEDGCDRLTFWESHFKMALVPEGTPPGSVALSGPRNSARSVYYIPWVDDFKGPKFPWLIVERWCDTDRPPGRYALEIELSSYFSRQNGSLKSAAMELSPPRRWSFPLEIKPGNPGAAAAEYQAILASIRAPYEGRMPDAMHRWCQTLVFARSAAAVPAQLDFIMGPYPPSEDPSGDLWKWIDLATRFKANTDPKVAEALTAWVLAKAPEPGAGYRLPQVDAFIWSIHEMSAAGSPEIREATAPVVQRFKRPAGPPVELPH